MNPSNHRDRKYPHRTRDASFRARRGIPAGVPALLAIAGIAAYGWGAISWASAIAWGVVAIDSTLPGDLSYGCSLCC